MVAGIAARQHGVVARRQLLALGLGRSAIQGRIAAGRLHRVHSGVYAVGHPIVSDRGRYLAAALACGPGAVVSYRSAAVLWAIAPEIEGPIHVTVGRGSHRRVGLVVHRARHLTDDQRGRIDSIPVTAIPRTLLDLASTMTPSALRRAFEESDRLGLLDHSALSRLLLITSGRRGTGRLARLLAEHRPLPATRSALERRFLRLCHAADLPHPAVNVSVAGLEVDCAWPSEKLVVELDGYSYHRGRTAFERDRRRDAKLMLAGYRVLRVTHRRLVEAPSSVVAEVRSLLSI